MMKYMGTIDRDNSMSLDHSEFAYSYAAMTHTAAEAIFSVLDENSDGQLTGKSCSYSTTRAVRDDHVRARPKINAFFQVMNLNFGMKSPTGACMPLFQRLEIMLSCLQAVECPNLLPKVKSLFTSQK